MCQPVPILGPYKQARPPEKLWGECRWGPASHFFFSEKNNLSLFSHSPAFLCPTLRTSCAARAARPSDAALARWGLAALDPLRFTCSVQCCLTFVAGATASKSHVCCCRCIRRAATRVGRDPIHFTPPRDQNPTTGEWIYPSACHTDSSNVKNGTHEPSRRTRFRLL